MRSVLAGRYRVIGIIGRGGMGTVYRVEDLALSETIALKVVASGTAMSPGFEQLRDEVKLARRVTHPNVARTFDIGEWHHLRFITMELVEGASLRDLIDQHVALEDALPLLRDIAAGLAAIHQAGIVHRDLKPENVLVTSEGTAKITDFGIARPRSALAPGMTTGTPRYMAPEVLAGWPATPQSDLYAFGLLAVEVLTHTIAHDSSSDAIRALLGLEREPISSFLVRCLARDPVSRPVSTAPIAELLAKGGRGPAVSELVAAPRLRIGAAVFETDASEAWLSDSLPAELLRALEAPEFEIVSQLVNEREPMTAAERAGLDVIVLGAVRKADESSLHASIQVVSTGDGIQLWARTATLTLGMLAAELEDGAAAIAEVLLARGHARRTTTRSEDPRVVELMLRASHAEHDPWREFNSDAALFLEQAVALAPDDPAVVAAFASCLLRGAGTFDSQRYLRARRAAERAVSLAPADPDAHMALAEALFVSDDPIPAIAALRIVFASSPSLSHAHQMLGVIASDANLLAEGTARSRLALALDPALALARANAAIAHELAGEHAEADALLLDGLKVEGGFARFLSAMTTVRLALWRGAPEDIAVAQARIEPHGESPYIARLVEVLGKRCSIRDLISIFPETTPEWARPQASRLKLEAELGEYFGEPDTTRRAIEALVSHGSYDAAWLVGCPSLRRARATLDLSAATSRVEARAARVQEALRSAGLCGKPRRRVAR